MYISTYLTYLNYDKTQIVTKLKMRRKNEMIKKVHIIEDKTRNKGRRFF